jgi:hypothetical protein
MTGTTIRRGPVRPDEPCAAARDRVTSALDACCRPVERNSVGRVTAGQHGRPATRGDVGDPARRGCVRGVVARIPDVVIPGPYDAFVAATVADVLAEVLTDPGAVAAHAPGPHELATLGADLATAATSAVRTGRWSPTDPLRLSKARLRWLLACPRRALAGDGGGDLDALVIGRIVDAAGKLAALGSTRPIDVDAALAFLAAQGDGSVAEHLDARGDASATLLAGAGTSVTRLVSAWPVVDSAWWIRVEDPVRVALADGAVTLAGRLDVVLGGPPSDRPTVIVEVKAGRWHDAMRADAHLYALLTGLRDGRSPAAVVTLVADGTTQVEPVRRATVAHAAERVDAALATAASVAAGEPAAAVPGSHCASCPVRHDCTDGTSWLAEQARSGGRRTP